MRNQSLGVVILGVVYSNCQMGSRFYKSPLGHMPIFASLSHPVFVPSPRVRAFSSPILPSLLGREGSG